MVALVERMKSSADGEGELGEVSKCGEEGDDGHGKKKGGS